MTKPDSRVRAICIHLKGTLVTTSEINSNQVSIVDQDRPSGRFLLHPLGAQIWKAVQRAGLPIIVITDLPELEILPAVNALPRDPDWVIMTASREAAATGLSVYEKVTADLRMNAHDVLYVGGTEENDIALPRAVGLRVAFGDDALEQVEHLSNQRRHALLSKFGALDDMLCHTVLLPLDLLTYTTSDPDDLWRTGRFAFDTVLVVEGVIPTSAIRLKVLEKHTGGFAVTVFATKQPGAALDVVSLVRTALARLRRAGASQVILVQNATHPDVDVDQIAAVARNLGYTVAHHTWATVFPKYVSNSQYALGRR